MRIPKVDPPGNALSNFFFLVAYRDKKTLQGRTNPPSIRAREAPLRALLISVKGHESLRVPP